MRHTQYRDIYVAFLILILLTACVGNPTPPLPTPSAIQPTQPVATIIIPPILPTSTPQSTISRTALTYIQLQEGFEPLSPLDEAWLARPQGAGAPEHSFEGRLELLDVAALGGYQQLRGTPETNPVVWHLPAFDFEFIQSGEYLVPVRRGLIVTQHPVWNYILEPGRAWQESGDRGLTRASFPFAIVARNGNGSRNGVMTFLFNEKGISRVWYQITQETTTGNPANFWGLLQAVYHPGPVSGAAQIRQTFEQEREARFPTRPIAQLAVDYPGVDVSAFGAGVAPANMTFYGMVVNGVNYVGGCQTRFGTYPYCESLRAASYSTAKSLFVSVALLRLAQKYGPQVGDLLIKDYVPEAAASPGDWSQVTFNHTLDMATGNYRSSGNMVDEDGRIFSEFFGAESYADKIRVAFDWPHSAPPGTRWVYRSSDTFILTTALQNYLKTKMGADADIFQFVVDEVYRPLQLGVGAFSTLRTSENDWHGRALGSSGMWWVPDDIAKLTTLLNVDRGAIRGEQILHPERLAAALQQNPQERGVEMWPGAQYNDAFWSARYNRASGYACEFWVPYMAGYSGNVVALLPNGATYYYFSDGREFTWDAAVREANKISPYCR